MDFAKLSSLHAQMGAAGNCPGPVLDLNARMAAIELCERTRCWRHKGSFALTPGGVTTVIPEQASIFEFEQASIDGMPLTPVHYTHLTGAPEEGKPLYITQTNPSGIIVFPAPIAADGPVTVDLSMFLTPRTDRQIGLDPTDPMADVFNVVPAFMLTRYSEALANGALARVLMMKGERWYDPQLAAIHREMFEQAMTRNFRANLRGQQRARIRTAYCDL